MKPQLITSFLMLLFAFSLQAETITDDFTERTSRSIQPFSATYSYQTEEPIHIETEGCLFWADSGSLIHNLDISMMHVPYKEGHAMSLNMSNVTALYDGIRLLPNGQHFSNDNPARITLRYNPDRIPMGYKPDNIYTYYCDSTLIWHRLERVAIDTIEHTITSLTTHFTDFANAVIKIPEMPESKAFVPTSATDLPDANPMRGIPMIEKPTPNNKGTAELTYPIELPEGRHGMQPNVDLHYSSAGGNGILGVGWSLTTPAITIDTRWGVPRYDVNYETEQYLVNGTAILQRNAEGIARSLPYQDNAYLQRTGGVTHFFPRDTKIADRIDRIGTNPTDYWWAVTDRNGITTYYGRTFDPYNPHDESIDENSVVRTANGSIAYWAATACVDVYGNYVRYTNFKHGNNVYVRQIDYTGNYIEHVQPVYRVCINYKNRTDKSSSGRLGILQEEGDLICHILVQYHHPAQQEQDFTDNLAAYYMQYTQPSESTLYKTRLAGVTMLDSVHDLRLNEICDLNDIIARRVDRNRLSEEWIAEALEDQDYLLVDKILTALSQPYGSSIPANVTQFQYEDAPTASNLFGVDTIFSGTSDRELSASHNTSWGLGGTATVGYGPNIFTTLFSGGGNYDYSRSRGECTSMLMDINGDGLADIVYENNNTVWFCKQYRQDNHYAFANAVQIQGLTRLSREITNTHTWGLQLSFGADLSYSNPISTTYTDTYFADVNGDGLPDMIDGDKILINHLTTDGNPSFSEFTGVGEQTISVHNNRCHGITMDGEVDRHIECKLIEVPVASYTKNDFFGSPVTYGIGAEEVHDEEIPYPNTSFSSDVIVTPQPDSVLHIIDSLSSIPIVIHRPEPYHLKRRLRSSPVAVNDSLIYRIEGDSVKTYRLEYVCDSLNIDPDIETVRVWVAPKPGNIILTDTIALLQDISESRLRSITADGVEYAIQVCDSITAHSDSMHLHAYDYRILKHARIENTDYIPHAWDSTFHVRKGDVIMFRLRSGDNNRFDKTHWRHIIQYVGETDNYDSQRDYICTGDGYFQAQGNGTVVLTFSGSNEGNEPVVLRVRKNEDYAAYILETTLPYGPLNLSPITVNVQAHDSIFISLSPVTGSTQEPTWSDVHIVPNLTYMAYFLANNSPQSYVYDTIVYYPDVHIMHSSFFPQTSPYRKIFGTLHKGWGAFAYQNINNKDTIILDSLVNSQLLAASNAPHINSYENYLPNIPSLENVSEDVLLSQVNNVFSTEGIYNPVQGSYYWVPMRADCRTEQWIAYGNLGCIGKKMHSNDRQTESQFVVEDIVEYDSPLPFRQGEGRINNFVRKKSRSVQHSISAGAVVMNNSISFGSCNLAVDYMDMNGDGFPDYVGSDGIQYSTPWGGIGKLQQVKNFSPFKSETDASGTAFSACTAQLEKIAGNNARSGHYHLNASLGASAGVGSSSTRVQFADVNADGLPDKIDVDSSIVRFNLGYSFSSPYPFYGHVSEGSNTNGSFNANISNPPFAIGQLSISGGVGSSTSTNTTDEMLIDINGDGLPDRIYQGTNNVLVAYNCGNQTFSGGYSLTGISAVGRDKTNSTTSTLGITGGFTFGGTIKFNAGAQSSPVGTSVSYGEVCLTDMNGDGLVDYVYKNNNGAIHVRYNKIGQANLLKAVINPTGQRILMDYSLSEPSTAHKSRQWNLKRIVDIAPHHPMSGAREDTIEVLYSESYYDNFEKTDYGYQQVRTLENREKGKRSFYHNQSLMQNGELYEDIITDRDGHPYIRRIRENRYRDIPSGQLINSGSDVCDDANTRMETDGIWTEYYEGDNHPGIITHYNVKYDQYHNMIEYLDEGDVSTNGDDWKQVITYLPNLANNMVSLPETEKVYNASNCLLRSSAIKYSAYGEPAHIFFMDTVQYLTAVTHLCYDAFGNINKIIFPEDESGIYNWAQFKYDPVTYSNIVYNINPHYLLTLTTYDYRWGLPKNVTDPAGNVIRYTYDYKGRLEKVRAPFEILHNKPYTVQYTYNLINHNLVITPPYANTHVYKEMYDSLFSQIEVSIFDERGKMLQKKHFAEFLGHNEWIVDGAEEWDAFGRAIAHEYPFIMQAHPYDYEPINNQSAIVQTTYDILDRPLLQTNADNSTKYIQYHFQSDQLGILRFLTRITDENGIKTKLLKSPQDRLIQQEVGSNEITLFSYSPLGELVQTRDADGYSTYYLYDMLGRMISRKHPDAGETKWKYDLAGNLVWQQTANLTVAGSNIKYIYDYGRIKTIMYPNRIENNVHYTYDKAGRISIRQDGVGSEEFIYDHLGNVAQSTRRIVIPTESNAYVFRTRYKYDSFGRMRNIIYPDGEIVHYGYTTGGLLKTVAGRKHGIDHVYLLDRQYDEQGRIVHQLVGNGVLTNYTYSNTRQWLTGLYTELPGGNSMQHLEYKHDYVGNITSTMQTSNPLTGYMIGGPYDNDYMYNDQYRLIHATGALTFPYSFHSVYSPAGRMGYKLSSFSSSTVEFDFGYDLTHRTHQPRTILDYFKGDKTELYWDANGNLAQILNCHREAMRLHDWDEENRLKFALGDRFAGYYGYDANGERIYKLTGICNFNQFNSGHVAAQAFFDDAVLYPNPYSVITQQGYTKHYYAGSERLATVMGSGGFMDVVEPEDHLVSTDGIYFQQFDRYIHSNDPFNHAGVINDHIQMGDIDDHPRPELDYECGSVSLEELDVFLAQDILYKSILYNKSDNTTEDEIYFYHGDHLGSANWITDINGDPVQYIHYAPYGELIDNQAPYLYDERYKFTGKERDQETGYDFFGARYLSSILSHWLSVDPLSDKYPNISPYAYCSWNPVNRIDPDGEEWIIGGLASEMQIRKNRSLSPKAKEEMITRTRHLEKGKDIRGKFIGALDLYNVFEFFAHGNQDGTGIYDKFTLIDNPNKLYAKFRSSPYLSSENSNSSIYILYSCYAGNGENSIAQQLSAIKEVSGSVVIAPTGPVSINERGNEYVKDGGIWNVFYKGTKIMEINGEEGSMTRFVQSKLKGEGLKQFLKQCEQNYKNIEQ